MAFDASGRRFLSAGADGGCRVYDSASGTLLHVLAGHTGEISKACFNPQGSRVITAGADKTCRWGARAGRRADAAQSTAGQVAGSSVKPSQHDCCILGTGGHRIHRRIIVARSSCAASTMFRATGRTLGQHTSTRQPGLWKARSVCRRLQLHRARQ